MSHYGALKTRQGSGPGAGKSASGQSGSAALRTCLVYIVMFSSSGLNQPYLPVWLKEHQLTDTEISIVLSVPMLLRVFVAPVFAAAADRARNRRSVISLLALLVFLLALVLRQSEGFRAILLVAAAMMLLSQAVSPIMDASVLTLVRQGAARDFGRIRLWGSVSFAVASVAGGGILAFGGADAVFGAYVAATGLLVVTSFLLPGTAVSPPREKVAAFRFFDRPMLAVVFAAAALVLASHSAFNSFGSIHLRDTGYPKWSIGMLWATATCSEIAMFWAGPMIARVLSPFSTLLLAAGAGVCRWSLMALDPDFAMTALLQLLHAATFSGSYLGLMHFVQANVADREGARAQSAFATMLGIVTAAATLVMGPLYRTFGSGVFLAAALLSLAAFGLLIAFRVRLHASGSNAVGSSKGVKPT